MRGVYRSAIGVVVLAAMFLRSDYLAAGGAATRPVGVGNLYAASVTDKHVQVTLILPSRMVCGKENIVEVVVHNVGSSTIAFSKRNALADVKFEIKTLSGNNWVVEPTQLYLAWTRQDLTPKATVPNKLSPGGEMTITVNLTRLFDLSNAVSYTICASWSGRIIGENEEFSVTTLPTIIRCDEEVPLPLK